MSLVSTYVQATDNELYKNPVIRGNDFFICFDDDDPPELVIKRVKRSDEELMKRAQEILKDQNIDAEFISDPALGSERCFSKEGCSLKPAWSIFLKIKSAIPIEAIKEHEGIKGNKVVAAVIYKWD